MSDNCDESHPPDKSSYGRVRHEISRYSAPARLKSGKTASKKPRKPAKKREPKVETADDVDPIRPFQMMFTDEMMFEGDFKLEVDRVKRAAEPILEAQQAEIAKEHEKMKACMGKLPDVKVAKKEPLVFETSGKVRRKIVLDVGSEPIPPPMTYYEPIEENIRVPDQPLLSHVPYISETMDDTAICAVMFKHFPEGIHGYLDDHARVNDYLFFQIMKSALEDVDNPDLFYYAMYRLWPNRGTQQKMSEIFPKLCARFGAGEDLTHLEPWKNWGESSKNANCKFPSIGNFFTYHLPVPSAKHGDPCSENCWKSFPMWEVLEKVNEQMKVWKLDDFYEILLRKDADSRLSESTGFLNALIRSECRRPNFCSVTAEFKQRSCLQWYRELLKIVDFPTQEQKFSMEKTKSWRKRDQTFRKLWAAKEQKEEPKKEKKTVFIVNPCGHFGSCGPEVPHCSCDVFCTQQCRCDINCTRRFPGCQCEPGTCRTKKCACVRISWDCQSRLCTSCGCDERKKVSCGNFEITLQRQKHVIVKQSTIADWGAFLVEDVAKHEFIGEYVGEQITREEAERRRHLYDLKGGFMFDLGDEAGAIDATRAGNVFRFVNKSRNPSCEIRKRMTAGKFRLALYARRNLKKGEELTFDYKYTDLPGDRVPKKDEKPSTSSEEVAPSGEDSPKPPKKAKLSAAEDVESDVSETLESDESSPNMEECDSLLEVED